MTRQEAEYLDAEVRMLHEYIETHGCHSKTCNECDGHWCIEHSSQMARIRYSQLYGCICGTCCRLCKDGKDCGFDGAISCTECDTNCGVNPKL